MFLNRIFAPDHLKVNLLNHYGCNSTPLLSIFVLSWVSITSIEHDIVAPKNEGERGH
jgi:hypothetical protein